MGNYTNAIEILDGILEKLKNISNNDSPYDLGHKIAEIEGDISYVKVEIDIAELRNKEHNND